MRWASAATVDASKSARRGSSTLAAARMRLMTWVASSECPPRAKKSSVMPTCGSRNTLAKAFASCASRSVRGGTYTAEAEAEASGAGSALRSTLPLALSGSAGSVTKAEGTMYSGSRCCRWARSETVSSASGPDATPYATSRLSPGTSSLATTTASFTDACARSDASISPSSMR